MSANLNSPDQHRTTKRTLRFVALGIGFFVLLWIPVEDHGLEWIILFATAISAWLVAYGLLRIKKIGLNSWDSYPLGGALAGIIAAPVGLLLMAIKSGIHAHDPPDFSIAQAFAILKGSLVWVFAGTSIGFGIKLWRSGRDQST